MTEEIDPIIGDDEQDIRQDERSACMDIVIEVLNKHPESKAACELILKKLDERTNEEVRTMLHVAHNIATLQPGSKKKQ
jgi:hypothetical protein